MYKAVTRLAGGLVLGGVLALAGCGDQKPAADELLSRVPADTPYVFANLRPLPADVTAKLMAMYGPLIGLYRDMLARPQVGITPEEAQALQLADALLAELDGNMSPEGYARLGLRTDARILMYGEGLLPVLRMELADGQKVRDLITRVETRSGLQAPKALYGDTEYRRIDWGGMRLLLAVPDNELVLALVPAGDETALLPRLFGDERPATTLAQSGEFQGMLASHDFPGYGDGYVDLRRLVAESKQLSAGDPGLAAEADACSDVVDGVLSNVPRLVMGVTEASTERYSVRMVAETSPAVGQVLAGLAYPVPGVGSSTDALFAMGLGVNVPRLRGALRDLLRGIAQNSGDCALVDAAAIEQAMPKLDMALGPMTAMFKGLYLELLDLKVDPATRETRDVQFRALAEVDDPRGVFAIAGMLNPELAQLEVPEDGTPMTVPAHLLPPEVPPLQVAIRERSLVLTAGGQGDTLARGLLDAKPAATPPLLSFSYNLQRMGELLKSGLDPLAMAAAAQNGESPEQNLADLETMLKLYDPYRVIAINLTAGPKGLVLDETVEFR